MGAPALRPARTGMSYRPNRTGEHIVFRYFSFAAQCRISISSRKLLILPPRHHISGTRCGSVYHDILPFEHESILHRRRKTLYYVPRFLTLSRFAGAGSAFGQTVRVHAWAAESHFYRLYDFEAPPCK